jgi:hypothetical protein
VARQVRKGDSAFCPTKETHLSRLFPIALIAASMIVAAGAASAQERLASSTLTGVPFPEQTWAWNDDENGARREAVSLAAAVAERSCGDTEFHAFQTSDPDSLRTGTGAAFAEAGWKLEDFSAGIEGQHIYRASKDGAEVVMTWFPVDSGTALLLCEALPVGAAGEGVVAEPAAAASEQYDDETLDLTQAPWLFTAAFGGIGALILGGGIQSRRRATASMRWPEAAGTVLKSEVVHHVSTDVDGDTDETWIPSVRYRYEVGGGSYESERLRFGKPGQESAELASKVLESYPVGSRIKVRYNPANPSDATVQTEKPGIGSAVFVGGTFLVLGAASLVVAIGS